MTTRRSFLSMLGMAPAVVAAAKTIAPTAERPVSKLTVTYVHSFYPWDVRTRDMFIGSCSTDGCNGIAAFSGFGLGALCASCEPKFREQIGEAYRKQKERWTLRDGETLQLHSWVKEPNP